MEKNINFVSKLITTLENPKNMVKIFSNNGHGTSYDNLDNYKLFKYCSIKLHIGRIKQKFQYNI